MVVVVLEGVSAVGKSTVKNEYFRRYDDVLMICRFTPSQFVYGFVKKREGRKIPIKRLLEMDDMIRRSAVIFHLTLDSRELETREGRDDTDLDVSFLETLYDIYYQLTPIPVEKIDTTGMTPSQIVDEMRRRLRTRKFL